MKLEGKVAIVTGGPAETAWPQRDVWLRRARI